MSNHVDNRTNLYSLDAVYSSPSALVARTRLLTTEERKRLDLLDVAGATGTLFVREGTGLAGYGEATRIDLAHGIRDRHLVTACLAAISQSTHDNPDIALDDAGPVALGTFAFRPETAASFVVPAIVVRVSDAAAPTLTTVGPSDAAVHQAPLPFPAASLPSPSNFSLRTPAGHASFLAAVETAVARIAAGGLEKVVLARPIDVSADTPIVVPHVLARLATLFPACMVFNVDGFLGASPELLIERRNERIRSYPLAGTVARSGDPDADARLEAGLLASAKERWEHAIVVDAIDRSLRPLCTAIDVPDVPGIVHLRNVSHLGTHVHGVLADPSKRDILDLVALLHPTPAVCGEPRAAAFELIAELESEDRGPYAGAVGWVDCRGNGTFAVGLRSASVSGRDARMWAGVGIVRGSEPTLELAETQLKFQALLAAIVRP